MRKYKIGEVSRLLALSNDTLRYYEGRGIVTPQKDEESGYRYYDAWDLNFLMDGKWYRSYDFPLADVVQMINEDDIESFVARCHKREAELLHTIYEYQEKLKSLVTYCQQVDRIKSELGRFEIATSPAMVFQRLRVAYDFDSDDETASLTKKWSDLMPFVSHTCKVTLTTAPNHPQVEEYFWGLSISPEGAIQHNIEIAPPTEYIPPRKSIRTVFSAGERNTFMLSLQTNVIEKIIEKGHSIKGPAVINLIVRLHEEGKFTRFFEAWVPIE